MGRPKKKRKYTKKATPNSCNKDLSVAAYWKLGGRKCKKAANKVVKEAAKSSTELGIVSDLGEQEGKEVIKKPVGRPRKHPLNVGPVIKRRRGRPKKYVPELGIRETLTRTYKHFGFCPGCLLSICSADIKYTKFSCPKCGLEGKVHTLKAETNLERPKTKKDYLLTVNSRYTDWYGTNGGKKNSDTLPSVESTIDTVPIKDEEENLLEEHDKDDHEKV